MSSASIPFAWNGYNDVATEGTFVWDDGATSTYTNWETGEPSGGSEDCGLIQSNISYRWNDAICSLETISGFLCTLR